MITQKQFLVLEFLINKGRNYNTSVHGTMLTKIIYDEETIKKYSFARTAKTVIDTMTFSYLGKMCRADLIGSEYQTIGDLSSRTKGYSYYCGHYCTKKGKEAYDEFLLKSNSSNNR
jgi:hypothetical protein